MVRHCKASQSPKGVQLPRAFSRPYAKVSAVKWQLYVEWSRDDGSADVACLHDDI